MTDTKIDMLPYVKDIVDPTIEDVWRKFGRWVNLPDLRQEAAVWWYGDEAQKYLPEYLAEDENFVRLRRSIWRFVARYAEREKAHYKGYQPLDQANYHPQEIVATLPVALDPDGVPVISHVPDGMPTAWHDPALGNTALAVLVDVRRALAVLPEDDLHFLTLADDLHHDWDRVAAYTDTLADSARRRHLRIAERMARWLNGHDNEETAA